MVLVAGERTRHLLVGHSHVRCSRQLTERHQHRVEGMRRRRTQRGRRRIWILEVNAEARAQQVEQLRQLARRPQKARRQVQRQHSRDGALHIDVDEEHADRARRQVRRCLDVLGGLEPVLDLVALVRRRKQLTPVLFLVARQLLLVVAHETHDHVVACRLVRRGLCMPRRACSDHIVPQKAHVFIAPAQREHRQHAIVRTRRTMLHRDLRKHSAYARRQRLGHAPAHAAHRRRRRQGLRRRQVNHTRVRRERVEHLLIEVRVVTHLAHPVTRLQVHHVRAAGRHQRLEDALVVGRREALRVPHRAICTHVGALIEGLAVELP